MTNIYYKTKYTQIKKEYLKKKYKTKYKMSKFEEEKLKTELKRLFKNDRKNFKVSYKLYKVIYKLFGYEFQQVFGKGISQYLVLKLIIKLYNNKVNIYRIIRYTSKNFDENQINNPSYLVNFIQKVQKKNKLKVFTYEEIEEIMNIVDSSGALEKLQDKRDRQQRDKKQSKQMERNCRRYRNKYEFDTNKNRSTSKLDQCKSRPVNSSEDRLINFLIRHEIIPCNVSEEFITVFKRSFTTKKVTKVTKSLTVKFMNPLFQGKVGRVLVWETFTLVLSVILQLSLLGGGIYSVYKNFDILKDRFGKYIPIMN